VRRINQRGVTLIELMVAMAIASGLLVISMTLHLSSLQVFRSTEDFASLSQDSYLITDYFRNEIMSAGGGSVRGWMGLWVEDKCGARAPLPDCQGSDRLTVTTLNLPEQECAITGQVSANVVSVAMRGPGDCCLSPQAGVAGAIAFRNQQVVLTLNGVFIQRYIDDVDVGTCQATLAPGPAAGSDSPGAPPDWTGAALSLVKVKTYYWDPTLHTLNVYSDLNNNATVDAGEAQVMADQVFDFQLALGYDFSPPDGTETEVAGGLNDEWLYNNPTAVEVFGAGKFAAPLTRSSLAMVEVALLLGTKRAGVYTATPYLLNGPKRQFNGYYLRPTFTKLAPRNTLLFQ
jgi:prepilin-type N-terminal cleavage/methylation domain-containing protein